MSKSHFTEEAESEIKPAPKRTGTPWIVKVGMMVLDGIAAVAILALAIIGARSLLDANMGKEVVLGIAIAIVGLLSARLVERVFAARR